jgi:spore maturation protein CgeB
MDRRSMRREVFSDRELVVFEDLRDAKEKTLHFLEHEEERRAFADRGRRRVLREHTYLLRMKELLGTLYEQGLRAQKREGECQATSEESFPPELRDYLASFDGQPFPELEKVIEMIGTKQQLQWEDRVFLTLMAFKEEAGCRISSS